MTQPKKYKTLEAAQHEIEIQAALERIRAKALAMVKREDIQSVAAETRAVLETLGIPARGTAIYVFDKKADTLDYYGSKSGHERTRLSVGGYGFRPRLGRKRWTVKINNAQEQRKAIDGRRSLANFPVFNYRFYFTGGQLRITAEREFDRAELAFARRVTETFTLAYKRFLELKEKEEQNRELTIQNALEKVRARALGMQESGEIRDVTRAMFDAFNGLGLEVTRHHITLVDEKKNLWQPWVTAKENDTWDVEMDTSLDQAIAKFPELEQVLEARRSGKSHYTFQRTAEEEWDAVRHRLALKAHDLSTSAEDMLCRLFTFFSAGWCLLFSRQPLFEDQIAIVGRIVGVFDFAYSRFLELKEKEQRARNAEIEAALERVRAHALGMQESGDIMGVATALRNGFEDLGYDLDQALIRIPDVSNKVMKQWIANPLISRDTAFREGREGSLDRRRAWVKKWEQKQKYWAEQVDRDWRASRIRASLTASGVSPADVKARIKAMPEPYFDNCLNFGAGLIVFGCAYAFSEEDFEIASRFADVFGIAYRRFRELEQKEEQNRELTIQNALERVRAQALGMQTSNELAGVATAIYKACQELGYGLDRVTVAITDDADGEIPRIWSFDDTLSDHKNLTDEELRSREPDDNLSSKAGQLRRETRARGDWYYTFYETEKTVRNRRRKRGEALGLTGDALETYINRKPMNEIRHGILHSHGAIHFHRSEILSEAELLVAKRFTDVFDYAYGRFLELKEKEDQNRELIIQNALERVRARALGMQESHEIMAVAKLNYEEMAGLGYDIWLSGIVFYSEDGNYIDYYNTQAPNVQDGLMDTEFFHDVHKAEEVLEQRDRHRILQVSLDARDRGDHQFSHRLEDKELQAYMAETLERFFPQTDKAVALARIPKIVTCHRFFIDDPSGPDDAIGALDFWVRGEPLDEAGIAVGRRFANAFEFAYSRFRELKEKEDQNRELTIQNALERIRARALGMQESTELGEVVWDLFEETTKLGMDPYQTRMLILKSGEERGDHWMASRYFDRSRGANYYRTRKVSEDVWFKPIMDAWHRGDRWYLIEKEITQKEYDRQGKVENLSQFKDRGVSQAEIEQMLKDRPLPGQMYYMHFIFFSYGVMAFHTDARRYNEDELDVLARFTNAFDFAYARFLELKEAEEQARESEQRAAVDRVRAEATAMAATDDIANVVKALWEGLMGQGLRFTTLVFRVEDEQAEELQMYVATAGGASGVQFPEENMMQRDLLMGVSLYRSTMLLDMMQADDEARRGIHTGIDEGVNKDVRTLWGFELPEDLIVRTQRLVVPFEFGQISVIREETPFAESDLACAESFAEGVSLGFTRYFDFRRLEAQNVALERANEEIQTASKLKSRFLATMSHELRTPMNAIIGFTRLVLRRSTNLEERQQSNLEKVLHSSNHLLNLINDVLDLSKIEADRMDMKPETFRVKDLIVSSCSTVSPLVREGVVLTQDFADDLGEVHTDAARLRQVMINLLSNALKFTEKGEVTVTVKGTYPQPLPEGRGVTSKSGDSQGQEVTGGDGTQVLEISVRDTGIGIPEDQLEIIFDEFRQVDGSSTRKVQGTGLGLSICRRLVELMGGTIGVESEVGKGSVFTVKIPKHYDAKQAI